VTSVYPEAIMQNNVRELVKDPLFRELDRLRTLIVNGEPGAAEAWIERMSPKAKAMVRRALPGRAFTNDVNRILANFYPADYLSLFILDKPAFYARFGALDPVRRDFAVKLIQSRYMPYGGKRSDPHKQALKEQFFGLHDI
jgi:hypothetical protein